MQLLRGSVASSVQVSASVAEDLDWVFADASQLYQVLLNLGVNARDAIDGAGTITYGPGVLADLAGALGSTPLAGETLYLQGYYRDPGGPCGSAFNFTNGLALTFVD